MRQYTFLDIPTIDSPLWYFGSKAKLHKYISSDLMDQLMADGEIVSPFIGGGSFELYLAAQDIRVHGSDNFQFLVDFWNQLSIRPDKVVDRVKQWWPHGNDGTDLSALFYELTDSLDQAALFWMINKASWSGLSLAGSACTIARNGVRVSMSSFESFRDFNSKNLSIDLLDYRTALDHHSDKIAYIDPPYVDRAHAYGDGSIKSFDHVELRNILANRKNFWLLSYGDHELIRSLYKDFNIREIEWNVHASGGSKGCVKKIELLITNK